ncbi:MAG TPA: BON domain-containing protein [Blastocatellia bacterium]|nr:BON domain-containing protein [Blastocatellia bacterium]
MKRLLVSLSACLILTGTTFVVRGGNSGAPTKAELQQAAVDCSKVDDATITANVKEKLAKTASLKDFTIEVVTTGGEVTLTGKVKTSSNKGTATRSAKKVACVKKVINQITYEVSTVPKKTPPKS